MYKVLFFFFLIVPNIVFSQNIFLKTPLNNSYYTPNNDSIFFSWENELSSLSFLQIGNDITFSTSTIYTPSTYNFQLNTDLLINQKYYWRIYTSTDTSQIFSFTLFDLNTIGSLVYHINAQNGVLTTLNKVYEWQNLTNSSYSATQPNATEQPELSSTFINGLDIVKFGGTSGSNLHYLSLPSFTINNNNFTVLSAYKQISTYSANSYLLGNTSPGEGVYSGGNFSGGLNFGLINNNTPNPNSNIRAAGTTNFNWGVRTFTYNKLYLNNVVLAEKIS